MAPSPRRCFLPRFDGVESTVTQSTDTPSEAVSLSVLGSGDGLDGPRSFERAFTIGRDASCDITIDSGLVSRTHARVVEDAGTWRILDCDSTNGLYLEGQRQEVADVVDGTVVHFGIDGPSLTFHIDAPSDARSSAPPDASPLRPNDPSRRVMLPGVTQPDAILPDATGKPATPRTIPTDLHPPKTAVPDPRRRNGPQRRRKRKRPDPMAHFATCPRRPPRRIRRRKVLVEHRPAVRQPRGTRLPNGPTMIRPMEVRQSVR